jgi:hypothetical protein
MPKVPAAAPPATNALPPLRLTGRDRQILETIYHYDGVVSLRQVDKLFFSGRGRSQPRARMRALTSHGYVKTASRAQRHRVPAGETIYWLGKRGAAIVAGQRGEPLHRFRWRKLPRLALLQHDLALNDFRIAIQAAAEALELVSLELWLPESVFWADGDVVSYRAENGAPMKRQVRPDGFFILSPHRRHSDRKRRRYAFLLELDMSTEDNPRFAREKVLPGIAYLKSKEYRQRFGIGGGRWLVVTTGERRLQNMMAQAERAGGAARFYFTTMAEVTSETVLDRPIWRVAGKSETRALLAPPHAAG